MLAEELRRFGEWSSTGDGDSIHRSILIIGVGNPILGDDGVGWVVAKRVATELGLDVNSDRSDQLDAQPNQTIEVDCLSLGGLALMERLIGYHKAIIIDAISSGNNIPGTIYSSSLSELPYNIVSHLASSHDTTLQNAVEVGRTMGASLPNDILIVGIETQPTYDFSETLSPALMKSIPNAVSYVMELIK